MTSSGLVSSGHTSAARPSAKPDKPETAKVALHGTLGADPTGSCATTLSFTLGDVMVNTTSATKYEHGTCADVKKGAVINVQGTKGADGVVTAERIEVRGDDSADDDDDDDAEGGHHDHHGTAGEVVGTVADLTGACSVLTFHVGRVVVSTTASTEFKGLGCSDLKNGDYVKVTPVAGDSTEDKAVVAKTVESVKHGSRPVEVTGKVSAVTGTCPTVSFTVGTTKLTANDRTHYRGLTCADLSTWTKDVVATARRQDDGSLLATQVAAAKDKH